MGEKELKQLLNEHGMRATTSRINVLLYMEEQKHPIGVEVLRAQFPSINEVTLYRMASDFVEKGIWNEINLGHGHTDYESANRPHHHHAVCESCNTIEEVYGCQKECQLAKSLSSSAKKFQSFNMTSTTIFGTCNNCAKA